MKNNSYPKDICVYHDNCLDGFAAAYVCHKNKPDAQFIAGQYSSEAHKYALIHLLQKTTTHYGRSDTVNLYLVDFSYNPAFLEQILNKFRTLHVHIIDHHKTAITDLEVYTRSISNDTVARLHLHLDDKHSGAYLTSKFFDKTPATVIRFVSDYDTWAKESKHTDAICAGLFHLAYIDETTSLYDAFKKWDEYYDINVKGVWYNIEASPKLRQLYGIGSVLNESRRRRAKHLAKADKLQMIDIAGHKVPLVQAPHEVASFAAEELVLKYPFVAVYYPADDKGCYSLRSSRKNPNWVDVETIAKMYGGGGHANAAGFKTRMVRHTLPKLKPSLWDRIVARRFYTEIFLLLFPAIGFFAGILAGNWWYS